MINIIKAEYLKVNHTFLKKLTVIAPIIALLLTFVLTAGINNAFPAGTWNWWYSLLLPGMLAIMCYLNIAKEKKNKYYYLNTLSISKKKLMLGKIIYIVLGLLLSNIIILVGTTVGGSILGTTVPVQGAVAGAILLTISFLWEIPIYMFLYMKFGLLTEMLSCIILSVTGIATVADKSLWWVYPASIPARLMCPTIKVLPNGLQVPIDSELLDTGVIFSGTIISIIWFVVATLLFLVWFEKKEVK